MMKSPWSQYKVCVRSSDDLVWEVGSFAEDYEQGHSGGGFLDFSDWKSLEIIGSDATDYLHRMSTANLTASSEEPTVFSTCFLNAKGGAISAGVLLRRSANAYTYWVPQELLDSTRNHLEMFLFSEDLELCAEKSDKIKRIIVGVWLPAEAHLNALGVPPLKRSQVFEVSDPDLLAWKDPRLNCLGWLEVNQDQFNTFLEDHSESLALLGRHSFEYERTCSGIGYLGKEVPPGTLVLEGGFDQAVSENKGCYPGQEVVERIRTYGKVNQRLVSVSSGPSADIPPIPSPLTHDGKQVGELWSVYESPRDVGWVGLALVRRDYWGSVLKLGRNQVKVGEPR